MLISGALNIGETLPAAGLWHQLPLCVVVKQQQIWELCDVETVKIGCVKKTVGNYGQFVSQTTWCLH